MRPWVLLVGFCLIVGKVGCAGKRCREEMTAIAEIRKLGGSYRCDGERPDSPIVEVDLGATQVTDAGLEHLKGMTNLEQLNLSGTQVTDAGLEHLTELTNLRWLFLSGTEVTDAGLEHLGGLSNLKWLKLDDTQVTDAGVNKLKKALPICVIEH